MGEAHPALYLLSVSLGAKPAGTRGSHPEGHIHFAWSSLSPTPYPRPLEENRGENTGPDQEMTLRLSPNSVRKEQKVKAVYWILVLFVSVLCN